MLATSRHTEAALQSYETVLASIPTALDVRWAKWSVLVRSGQVEEAVIELQRIAAIEPQNPLIHLRLARELRKLDRLEESFKSYQQAVELGPDMLNWRLAMARARFDIWITKAQIARCNLCCNRSRPVPRWSCPPRIC